MREIIFVIKEVEYTLSKHSVCSRCTLTCQIQGDTMRIIKYDGYPAIFAECQQEAYRFAQSNNIPYIIADLTTEYPKLETNEILNELKQCGFHYVNNGINEYFIREVKQ